MGKRRRSVPQPEVQAEWTARSRQRLAELRAAGVKLGRPQSSPVALAAARKLVIEGWQKRDAAQLHGISYQTLRRHLQQNPITSEAKE